MGILKGLNSIAKVFKGNIEIKKIYQGALEIYSSAPIYSIALSPTSINEGSSTTATITTENVPDGTTLYWTIAGVSGTINSSDFTTSLSGSVMINSNTGSFTITARNDVTTEGSEVFKVELRTNSTSGTIVANSNNVTIGDTSRTPTFTPPFFPPFFPPPNFTPPFFPPFFPPPEFTPPFFPPFFPPPNFTPTTANPTVSLSNDGGKLRVNIQNNDSSTVSMSYSGSALNVVGGLPTTLSAFQAFTQTYTVFSGTYQLCGTATASGKASSGTVCSTQSM